MNQIGKCYKCGKEQPIPQEVLDEAKKLKIDLTSIKGRKLLGCSECHNEFINQYGNIWSSGSEEELQKAYSEWVSTDKSSCACTCGVGSLRDGGLHSPWCDKNR